MPDISAATPRTLDPSLCPLCGKANQCAMEIERLTGQPQEPCWCVGVDFSPALLAKLPPAMQNQACICTTCSQSAFTEA